MTTDSFHIYALSNLAPKIEYLLWEIYGYDSGVPTRPRVVGASISSLDVKCRQPHPRQILLILINNQFSLKIARILICIACDI